MATSGEFLVAAVTAALTTALRADRSVHSQPLDYGGAGIERLAIAQADHELAAGGLTRRLTAPSTEPETHRRWPASLAPCHLLTHGL